VFDVPTVEEQIKRPLWEGDQEVVKRSCRDEPVWVVIHMGKESLCIAIFISS
jgi:hypothetical protein